MTRLAWTKPEARPAVVAVWLPARISARNAAESSRALPAALLTATRELPPSVTRPGKRDVTKGYGRQERKSTRASSAVAARRQRARGYVRGRDRRGDAFRGEGVLRPPRRPTAGGDDRAHPRVHERDR